MISGLSPNTGYVGCLEARDASGFSTVGHRSDMVCSSFYTAP